MTEIFFEIQNIFCIKKEACKKSQKELWDHLETMYHFGLI